MRIIFMGTPEFACPTLEKLVADDNFDIAAIYSREPKIAGRGHKVTNSPIHQLALKHNLKVITPKTLRDDKAQEEFRNLNADAAVIVAYGLILPTEILQGTKLGCFNIHPSLLPKWRGASPIQRPIMAGDQETGITIIKMDEGLDSGDMIAQEQFSLTQNETYQELADHLAKIGADILLKTLKKVENKYYQAIKQDNSEATYAKKITKTECQINWQDSALEIERKIRGLNGSLGAYFMYNNEKIKIFSAKIIDQNSNQHPLGTIIGDQFHIQCGQGIIQPTNLQRQGKKPVALRDFLLGFRIKSNLLDTQKKDTA